MNSLFPFTPIRAVLAFTSLAYLVTGAAPAGAAPLVATAPAVAGTELVVDGDFATNPFDVWFVGGDEGAALVWGLGGHGGENDHSVKAYPPEAGGWVQLYQLLPGAVPGATYTLSAWFKGTPGVPNSGVCGLQNIYGARFDYGHRSFQGVADDKWHQVKVDITIPDHDAGTMVYCRVHNRPAITFDDISVVSQ